MSHPAMDQTGNTFRNMDFNKEYDQGQPNYIWFAFWDYHRHQRKSHETSPDEVGVHPELSDVEIVGEKLKLLGQIAAISQIVPTHNYNMRSSLHGHLQNKLTLSDQKKF